MKKLLSLILAALLMFSLVSCAGTPDAKELYLEAVANSRNYKFALDAEVKISTMGQSSSMTLALDGAVDDANNLRGQVVYGDPTGKYTTYQAYILPETSELYFRTGELWVSVTEEDLMALFGQAVDFSQADQQENTDITLTEEALGLAYSKVTKEDGIYKFTISGTDKTVEFFTQSLAELPEEEAATVKAVLDEINFAELVKSLVVNVEIDAETKTLKSYSCDISTAANDLLQKLLGILQDPSTGISIQMNIDKCAIDMELSDVGNITSITMDYALKANAMSFTNYLIMHLSY